MAQKEKRNAYGALVEKPERKRPLWRHSSRLKSSKKIDFKETE